MPREAYFEGESSERTQRYLRAYLAAGTFQQFGERNEQVIGVIFHRLAMALDNRRRLASCRRKKKFDTFSRLCFTRVRPVGFNDEPGEPLVRQYHPQPLECSAETVARQDQELDVNEGPSQFGEQPGLAHAE